MDLRRRSGQSRSALLITEGCNYQRNSGAVRIFDLVTYEAAALKAPNVTTLDLYGSSVALSDDGQTLVVAALREGSNAQGVFSSVRCNSG